MTEPRLIGPSLDGVHPIFFPESVPSALPPECYPAPSIDTAIEQVVKTGGDPEALTEAVRTLAGLLGYRLVANEPIASAEKRPPAPYKHFIADMDAPAACGHVSGSMQCTLSRWLTTCPDCIEVLT